MSDRNTDRIDGELIEEALEEVGMTQNQFAKSIGKTRQYVNLVVRGKRQLKLNEEQLLQLSEDTGVDVDFWLALSKGELDRSLMDTGGRDHEDSLNEAFEDALRGRSRLERQWAEIGPRVLTDGEIEMAVEADYLVIEPFDADLLCPTKMYCTIADRALVSTESDCEVVSLGDGWKLDRDEFMTVKSEQKFKMPARVSAELGQVAENVRSGVVVHHGLGIDPTWEGRLICRLENRGAHPVTIQTGMKLLSARFEFVATKPKRKYQAVPHSDVEEGFSDLDLRTAGRRGGVNKAGVKQEDGNTTADNEFERTIASFLKTQNEAMQANAKLTSEFLALLRERRS